MTSKPGQSPNRELRQVADIFCSAATQLQRAAFSVQDLIHAGEHQTGAGWDILFATLKQVQRLLMNAQHTTGNLYVRLGNRPNVTPTQEPPSSNSTYQEISKDVRIISAAYDQYLAAGGTMRFSEWLGSSKTSE